ncbi:MAG: endonuclease [Kiritimatiellae bacterium]|nr:endonuclease [Kiritimatiellia bacterium]
MFEIRCIRAACRIAPLLVWLAGARLAPAGYEDFVNYPATGTSYASGTFLGRDGSTWSYAQCRGDRVITAPSPCMNKETTAANITSGSIAGGCGALTFEWRMGYSATNANGTNVCFDVTVNGALVSTVRLGVPGITYTSSPVTVDQAGNFILKFAQHNATAKQVIIDNIAWTPYGGGGTNPPELILTPPATSVVMSATNLLEVDVGATEPDADELRLWATGLPAGATFAGATGAAPLACTFSWTPALVQTGSHTVVFHAGDKDGTNQQALAVLVLSNKPYYYGTEALAGPELRAALHEIVSTGSRQLTDDQENTAMKDLDTDPANTNNIICLYRRVPIAKSLYNDNDGWNKEHAWPESRGLGGDGPDQNDVHNLFAADADVNAMRGNLYFDESNPADPSYRNPATNTAPQTSLDSDSWEPPDEVKGDIARALFYMDVRYDGLEANTEDIQLQDALSDPAERRMGVLTTLRAWHEADPPSLAESNRNEKIYATYQYNRNPFIDHPEWVASIFDPETTPPVLQPIGVQTGGVGAWLRFEARATATQNDPVTLTVSNGPAGSALYATNTAGTFSWMPDAVGIWTVRVYAADNDGADFVAVPMTILVDQDGDGLPSWWEQLYFDGGTNATPSQDSDGDFFSNLQEWIAGSHPRDSNSFLAAEVTWQGGALRVSGDDVSTGRVYTLERAAVLADGAPWEPVGATNDLQGGAVLFDLSPTQGGAHYRIRAERP